eukprot:3681151-Rhodomonas_salina.5
MRAFDHRLMRAFDHRLMRPCNAKEQQIRAWALLREKFAGYGHVAVLVVRRRGHGWMPEERLFT